MKKFFEKHELLCCMLLIVLYVVLNSYCMQNFGLTDFRSVLINTLFSAALLIFTLRLGRAADYGLVRPTDPGRYLYFLPLLLIISVNLWTTMHS